MAPQLHTSQSTLLSQLPKLEGQFPLFLFSLFKINSETFISELQRKSRDRCSPGVNGSPNAFLRPVSGHMAGVCLSLRKSYGASLVQAQDREKAWSFLSLPRCPSADTICMPSAAQQFRLLLWAWHVGSGCQGGITLRKGNRWELMLCFPAKYPPKMIWLILCIGMSRTLTCEAMENTRPSYYSITNLSAELQHLPVWMLSTHVNSW